MLRICKNIILCSAFSLAANASANPTPAEIQPLAAKSLLLDIVKVNNQKLIVVGERGHILLSLDGENWQQKSNPSNSTLNKVYFYNEQLGWAVGHDSLILNTQDGGESWQIQNYQPEKQRPLFDVLFFDPLHGMAIGAYGSVYRSRNGGKSWQQEHHLELLNEDDRFYLEEIKVEDEQLYKEEIASILPHFNRLALVDNKVFLVGELGLLASSDDFGASWNKLDEIYMGSFFDIQRLANNELLVAGLRGNIFFSATAGEQWQKIASNTKALLNDIVISEQGKVAVLANSGVLLLSNDGRKFSKQTEKDGKALMAGVWFNNKFIVASEVGIKVVDIK